MLPRGFVLFLLLALSLLSRLSGVSAQASYSPSDSYNGKKVTPTMLVIIIILIIALFFMGFLSVYIRQCADSQFETRLPGRTIFLGRGSRALRGLDPSLVDTFPTLQYSEAKAHKIGKGGIECAVCLNEFEENETLRLIPNCNHVFHQTCIDPWLASHVTCPVCRANLDSPPVAEELPPVHQAIEAMPEPSNPTQPPVEPALGQHGAISGRREWSWFPRSHTTGHSPVRPGENTERFTLTLPEEVRQQIMTRHLERSASLACLPTESSSGQGYRADEGGHGKPPRPPGKLGGRAAKSDNSVLARNPSLLLRASLLLTRASSRSPKQGEGSSSHSAKPEPSEADRSPV